MGEISWRSDDTVRERASEKDEAMDLQETFTKPLKDFAKNSVRLVKRCTKPDSKEYKKICLQTVIGFSIMGFIGFFVKLIFIPINNIIMGGNAEAATEAAAA